MTAGNRDFYLFLWLAASLHAAALFVARVDAPATPALPKTLRLRFAPVAPFEAATEQAAPLPSTPDRVAPPQVVSPRESERRTVPEAEEGTLQTRDHAAERVAPSTPALPQTTDADPRASVSQSAAIEAAARASYEQLLAAWLDKYKYYPTTLRRRGIEGEGELRVRLGRDGRVLAVESAEGFGSRMLETVARDWVARADPFPEVPATITGTYYLVRFPVRFRLR